MLLHTVTQNQFDAPVSFCYNLGTGSLRSSTLLKKISKKQDDPAISTEFMKWVHAGGKVLKGLKRRGAAKTALYFTL